MKSPRSMILNNARRMIYWMRSPRSLILSNARRMRKLAREVRAGNGKLELDDELACPLLQRKKET